MKAVIFQANRPRGARRPKVVVLAGTLVLAASAALPLAAAEESLVGRVRVTTIEGDSAARTQSLQGTLEGRFAPRSGQALPDKRIISVRPHPTDPERFDVTIYDYASQQGFELLVDQRGKELARLALPMPPPLAESEFQDALALVGQRSIWAEGIAKGTYQMYPAMPAVSADDKGRRLISVGVLSSPGGTSHLAENEVVSVDLQRGKIIRYAAGAPESSRTSLVACNPPPSSGCGAAVGSCATYHVEWPAASPVWKFDVRHPNCTSSVQPSGTGLELTNVYYNNVLILQRAEMPVLNVLYENNTCGPFRDWLNSEDCFQATGTDVPSAGSGIRVTTGNPTPYTFCEANPPSDAGNFKGVAIHDQGNALYLLTETNAGWYRYVMEWRLYLDGTIEPVFGFGATANGCTCNLHFHHAYWRFEWAIGGTAGNYNTGIDTIERRRPGTLDQYDPVALEGAFLRPATNPESDWFRIRSVATQSGYIIQPGIGDGQANGDTYGKWDLAALAYKTGCTFPGGCEIDDPNTTSTSISIDPWIASPEALGTTKRLVTWYHATYAHNGNVDPEPCELVGPRLVFVQGCAGSLGLDRATYACGGTVAVTLDDADLRGAGTASVAVSSTTEVAPETAFLAESPANSGHFSGTITTIGGPPVASDGKVSVASGDALTARYVDASACGAPNINVDKSATVDCVAPAVSGVQATSITSGGATITWSTNESSTSVVHYGMVPPGSSAASTAMPSSAHSVALAGLAPCTTYYYWVESADGAGNLAASNAGGGYYAFRTAGGGVLVSYASADTPRAIPDSPDPNGATSTISVADARTVQDVNATVNITHTFDGDLALTLSAPNGAHISLSNRHGSGGDNYTNTVFDDEASVPIASGTAPFTGAFRPDAPLSAADASAGSGAWKLNVLDQAGVDTGTIDAWALTLTYPSPCPAGAPPRPVPDGTTGTSMRAARMDPAASKVHLSWDVSSCASPNYHLVYGPLTTVASYALDGGVCALGPLGTYDWSAVPGGSLWFLVVGDNAAGVEGSWGRNSAGTERALTSASGQCGCATRDNTGTCP